MAREDEQVKRLVRVLLPAPGEPEPTEAALETAWMQVRGMSMQAFSELWDELRHLAYPLIACPNSTGEWMGVPAKETNWDSIVSNLTPEPGRHVGLSVVFRGTFVRPQAAYRVVAAGAERALGSVLDYSPDEAGSFEVHRTFSAAGKVSVPITVYVVRGGLLLRAMQTLDLVLEPEPDVPQLIEAAMANLTSNSKVERDRAFRALRRLRPRSAAQRLLDLARTHADADVRDSALTLLSQVGGSAQVKVLAEMLGDPKHSAHEHAIVRALVALTGYRTTLQAMEKYDLAEARSLGRNGWRAWIVDNEAEIRGRLEDPK
jgi:hypothetical protein